MQRGAGTCVLLAAGGVRRGLATGVDVGAGASVGLSVGVSLGASVSVGIGMRVRWGEVAAGLPNRGDNVCKRAALAAAAARRRQRVAERAANASTAKHVKPCVEVGGGLLEDVHVPGFVRYA